MAKSMRVNRNKRYSKKRRTNNRANNRKSARKASKRNSRRRNSRNLRGGTEPGGPVTALATNAAPGFDNPLYAAIKEGTDKAKDVEKLLTEITGVMKLLSDNILLKDPFEKKDISNDEELSQAIVDARNYVDSIASRTDIAEEYQDANLTGLLILLDELKVLKVGTYSDEDYIKAIQEFINGLGVFAASYNYKTKKDLDDFRERVTASGKSPEDEYIEVYKALPKSSSLSASELLYGKRPAAQEPAGSAGPGPVPEPKPSTPESTPSTATGGTYVFVEKDGDKYKARVISKEEICD